MSKINVLHCYRHTIRIIKLWNAPFSARLITNVKEAYVLRKNEKDEKNIDKYREQAQQVLNILHKTGEFYNTPEFLQLVK